jgi:hypothetical protein
MEIIIAKMTGMIIPLATYNIVNKANKPMKKIDAFVNNGNFILSSVTTSQDWHFFYEKYVERETGLTT